jgi:hypothetical protein
LFTGFDHSPTSTGGIIGHADGLKIENFNQTQNSRAFETENRHLRRQEIDVVDGLSFAPFCYLLDTPLGIVISEQISRVDHSGGLVMPQGETTTAGTFVADNIGAQVWTGLQIRARLKPRGDQSGYDDPRARAAMAVLLDGETGMSGWGEDGEVFFTEWSKGMRSDLLAVGYDNMAKTELAKSKIRERFGDPTKRSGQFASAHTGPYYTRSFPILASLIDGNDPEYGDQLYMHTAPYAQVTHIDWLAEAVDSGPNKRLKGHPFAFIHGNGEELSWGEDEVNTDPIRFNIAKGFWSGAYYPWGGTNNNQPFIDKLRIYQNGYGPEHSSPVYKEFDIEYQINLLYRVKVKQTVEDAAISDTDWLVVHPRQQHVNYVDKGKDTLAQNRCRAKEADQPLNWLGTNKNRINGAEAGDDAETDIWIEPRVGGIYLKKQEFYFDGYSHDEFGGGIHLWSRNLHQSSGNHSAAFFQKGRTGGGIFKQLESEN